MSHQSDLIATDIDAYLEQHENKELLRFLTCGSVDDGKSTLIGRLLYDSKMIYEDQLAALEKDSATVGTTGGGFDPALLTDGLKAEREQGITIDVAYRYFSTAKRKFIIADTPGHEQYTRNMATGASTCDLAIILVDARHGVMTQTKRHSFIVSLLGIKHVIIAINKMDLVDYSEETYNQIKKDYTDFSSSLDGMGDLHFIPMSALDGDNVVDKSENMPWYDGSTLMHMLENVHIASDRNLIDFRFPVQFVNRPHLDFRGFCGTIASGRVRQGDEVMVLPSRKKSRVKEIVTYDGNVEEAFTPQSVTLTFEDEIDCSRGDMIVRPNNVPKSTDSFDATIVWMSEDALTPGKQYVFKQTTRTATGSISKLRYRIDVNTLHSNEADKLDLNEIGRCEVRLNRAVAMDGYKRNKGTGAFIVIDRVTNVTVGAGMILDRSSSDKADHWEQEADEHLTGSVSEVTAVERAGRYGQQPATVLFTGLAGSGKTTLVQALERKLFDQGRAVCALDGQNMRKGISRDLGFSAADRSENLRRSAEVAKLMNDSGLICLGAFIAPSEEVRQKAADVVGRDKFLVIHCDAPIEVCRERDTEGHYKAADAGDIANMPGVTSEYEVPTAPDLTLKTAEQSVEECVEAVLELLAKRSVVG
ncbi:MAG: sulfate adenylyltransferase subunit CysN [Lacipirellulaceae bacterium]